MTNYIKKIRLPNGNLYFLKDEEARQQIEEILGDAYLILIGVTTTPISDNSNVNPIIIDGQSVTAVSGNIAIYDGVMYVWNDGDHAWHAFGNQSMLGDLARFNVVVSVASTEPAQILEVSDPNNCATVIADDAEFSTTISSTVSTEKLNKVDVLDTAHVPAGTENLVFSIFGVADGTISSGGTGDSVVTGVTGLSAATTYNGTQAVLTPDNHFTVPAHTHTITNSYE